MAEYEKRVRELLAKNGCTFLRRGKGDHDIWFSPITGRSVTVNRKQTGGVQVEHLPFLFWQEGQYPRPHPGV